MPINIYRNDAPKIHKIAWLCDGSWDLAAQVDALISWLEDNGEGLPSGSSVADIGFCWRRDASGGGAVLPPEAMKKMADLGMCLFLSEYSGFSDSDS